MQPVMTREAAATAANHLVRVPGSDWAFWRWVCVRSAGFPLDGVLKLASVPDLGVAADQVFEAAQGVERVQKKAAQEVNVALDELRSKGQWNDKKKRKALLNARIAINAMDSPDFLREAVRPELIDELNAAIRHAKEARSSFQEKFTNASEETTSAIREIAASADFREAVTWQNRSAVIKAIDPLWRKEEGGPRNSRQRQREELVASYWQRYCAKNDTIGFFGPVGWGRFVPEVEYIRANPGAQLVSNRQTYWEAWAIDALAATITRKYNIQPWIVPILMPFVRVAGTVLYHPLFNSVPLTPGQALLLSACNGRDTAKAIAEKMLRLPGRPFRAESQVYEMLSGLAAKRFVFWALDIPMGPYPERGLRTALQRIENPAIRQETIKLLDQFELAKCGVEAATGNAEKLNVALDELEQVFTRTTDLSANRNQGKAYAGRTVVYEDCRRDLDVQLGPQLLESFVQPLSLLLTAGRWFTVQLARAYEKKLWEIYSKYTRPTGNASVDAGRLWSQAAPLFFEESPTMVLPLQEQFRQKWEQILQIGTRREPIHYTYEEISQPILKEFAADGPGWIGARYHSPDVMIAAASEEAIRQNDCFFVLGEMHIGTNTLDASLFVNQHPSPDELLRGVDHDLRELPVVPIGQRDDVLGSRTTSSLVGKSAFRLEHLPNSFVSDRSRSIPVSSLVVENQKGVLVAKTRNGRICMRVIDLLGQLLCPLVIDCFRIVAPRPHTPRISIDRLVIKRESWKFSPAELQFAQCDDSAETFLQTRRWAQEQGIPRFVFFKVPVENKPAYLDFESPILVDIFTKLVRRTVDANLAGATVDLSEMLPTLDRVWLADKDNRRYTSEFRIVAVDACMPPALNQNGSHPASR